MIVEILMIYQFTAKKTVLVGKAENCYFNIHDKIIVIGQIRAKSQIKGKLFRLSISICAYINHKQLFTRRAGVYICLKTKT